MQTKAALYVNGSGLISRATAGRVAVGQEQKHNLLDVAAQKHREGRRIAVHREKIVAHHLWLEPETV